MSPKDLVGSWRFSEDFEGIHRRREKWRDGDVNMGCVLGTDCLIKAELEEVAELGEQVVVVIRNLRKDMEVRKHCSAFDDCPILQSFNSMIDEVIQEINDEWDPLL